MATTLTTNNNNNYDYNNNSSSNSNNINNTSSSQTIQNLEPGLDLVGRERCFTFTKLNRLTTTSQVFPEALELIAESERNKSPLSLSQQPSQLLLLTSSSSLSSSSPASMTLSARNNRTVSLEHEIKSYQSAREASLARKRGVVTASTINGPGRTRGVHVIEQRQLFNMARYRNILRYQMGRQADQSILLDDDDDDADELVNRRQQLEAEKRKSLQAAAAVTPQPPPPQSVNVTSGSGGHNAAGFESRAITLAA